VVADYTYIFGSDKGNVGVGANAKLLPLSARVVRPETSRMIIYDPRQIKGMDDCMIIFFYRKWSA
jgi:hypothetical protein